MSSLRILLVARDEREAEEIGAALTAAGHTALSANSLEEAAEALSLQKFDAVLLGQSATAGGLEELATRLQQLDEPQHLPDRSGEPELPVFELDEFREQVGHDPDLAAEIVDLFLSESEGQVSAMRAALASRDYAQLRPLAHTIKGSFGSLHAPRARARAQQLESGAAQADAEACSRHLEALEADLAALKPELLTLRANGGQI